MLTSSVLGTPTVPDTMPSATRLLLAGAGISHGSEPGREFLANHLEHHAPRNHWAAWHGGHNLRNSTFDMALIIAVIAGASLGITRAGEPRPEIPARLVLERFDVARGGDCLLVPVRIAGKDRRFVVDTGSSLTVLDFSLCPRERMAVMRVKTSGGDIDLINRSVPFYIFVGVFGT